MPLVLETATPTFNKEIPTLHPWTISTMAPRLPPRAKYATASRDRLSAAPPMAMSMAASAEASSPPAMPMPEMSVRGAEVSKGGGGSVSATFTVPGKMSIPSDGGSHNVTIVQLKLDAKMTWISVPRKGTKVHLSVSSGGPSHIVSRSCLFIRPRSRTLPTFCCFQGMPASTWMGVSSLDRPFHRSPLTSLSTALSGKGYTFSLCGR